MQSDAYPEKYVFFINQLLDPHHPEAGNFKQRVILSHVGFDRPTVLVTEGYAAHYATHPRYQEELSKLFNANLVFVEYRYFGESMPKPCNWDYLTVENSCTTAGSLKTKMMSAYMNPIVTVQSPSFAKKRSARDAIASNFGFSRG